MQSFKEFLDEEVHPALLVLKEYIGVIPSKISLKGNGVIQVLFKNSDTTDRFIDLWLSKDESNIKMKQDLENSGVTISLKTINSRTVSVGQVSRDSDSV